ncbi:MAG: bifunctional UDP-sugar hydrolase/5'-nucleotidase [Chloroflexota bacterium]|nr:bifunctional UDP-sugar hydrolase/5'-nucleotidase [Chloroflexota bacterium]
MNIKEITILHSNDMHGDFLAEASGTDGDLIGGLALLSGYINEVRKEEENVLFVIAGDMLQGSLIDTEYKGLSTIELMNYLAPDVVTIGNHEIDYGLSHLLFLEKLANFPIVNANLYIKKYNKRLLQPHIIIKIAGLDILFTGIITEKIIDSLKMDELVGSFVSVEEAAHEVGKICNAYKNDDIDLTVLLTHIGYESDLELAKLLKPEWGVDMILGGHTHTFLEKPTEINNILIAQAGVGTNQIGRFDITVDDDTNSIVDYKWKLIPINNDIAEPDEILLAFITSFKEDVDRKYNTLLTKFTEEATHPDRVIETSLGNIFADALAAYAECDVMFLGSGSIRQEKLGPLVTLNDFISCFPYDDTLTKFYINGSKLQRIFAYIMRVENRDGEGECYQVNAGVQAIYDNKDKKLEMLKVGNEEIDKDKSYTICLQNYHLSNCADFLGITEKELQSEKCSKVVSTSVQDSIEEYLRNNQNIKPKLENRLVYK